MFPSTAKLAVATASFMSLSILGSSVYAADMVETYQPPRHVVVEHYHHHHRHYVPVRVTRIRTTELDCGNVIYDYRSDPAYTEVKTVCSPPWTKPSTNDY